MSMGNLSTASPVGVLPQMKFTQFAESRLFPMLTQAQHDSTIIRSLIVDGVNPAVSLKSWQMSARLTAAALATLKSFYEAHLGGLIPFYFYNLDEVSPGHAIGSNYDATGSSTQGRYAVRFGSDTWTETVGLGRTDVSFTLTEAA